MSRATAADGSRRRRLVIGIDTGGTFTDLAAVDVSGDLAATVKVPSTPADPSAAIETAIRTCLRTTGLGPRAVAAIVHGTTIATNALLQRRGVRTALVVDRGFRDLLLIGRQNRPDLYDGRVRRPEPLVPRSRTFEVGARLRHDGSVEAPLEPADLARLARQVRRSGVRAVAVCLLHAYRDPAVEDAVAAHLETAAPGVRVTRSAALVPLAGEVERASTAVVNAHVDPIVDGYLRRLADRLDGLGVGAPVFVMQSNGGLASAAFVRGRSVHTVLSGPAAGVIGGRAAGARAARRHLVTVDMGGTSFDISVLPDRRIGLTTESDVGGNPVALPTIDIHTLGAGGGSVAWLDDGGALRVGPHSAGADPGPAAYGRGGRLPTVTDANVVLGRLPGPLLDGALPLDAGAARAAIERTLARAMGCSTEEAALGIVAVVNAEMVRGIRRMSVARGWDPRELALVAFGGAGPLHAVELARELGIEEVVIPPAPGATSAAGLLAASVRRDLVATVLLPATELSDADLARRYAELDERALDHLRAEGVPRSRGRVEHRARLAYRGQGYDLEVAVRAGPRGLLAAALAAFRQAHLRRFGYARDDPVLVVSIASAAVGGMLHRAPRPSAPDDPAPAGRRSAKVGVVQGRCEGVRVHRSELARDETVEGPAIVEQLDTTTLLPPGSRAVVAGDRSLVVSTGGSTAG